MRIIIRLSHTNSICKRKKKPTTTTNLRMYIVYIIVRPGNIKLVFNVVLNNNRNLNEYKSQKCLDLSNSNEIFFKNFFFLIIIHEH